MKSSAARARVSPDASPMWTKARPESGRSTTGLALATMCGILSPAVYIVTDIVATRRYPGFSYSDQAVSELFAIGAPTSDMVVTWFTVSSVLQLMFAVGMWRVAAGNRLWRLAALMLGLSAVDALVLWNAFPMHMRGAERSKTDVMHLALSANPFWIMSLVAGALAFRSRFRVYSIVMLCILLALAGYGYSYAPALVANGPTPRMGLVERVGQYLDGLWQAVLAVVVWRQQRDGATSLRS